MKRILVIEDNLENMYLMRFILEKNSIFVIEAKTGENGMALSESENPDLILMDIQLPDINGFEITRRINAKKRDKSIPIIALTSYAMPGDREKALQAGCSGYIEKPINPETIMQEINKHL